MKKLIALCLLTFPVCTSQAQYANPLFIPPAIIDTSFVLTFDESTRSFYPGLTTGIYAINGSSPGPTLIVQKDDTISVSVVNQLSEETSCHWHGLHVPARYDGGPHTTIAPGDTWDVRFRIMNKAATYWYHPHVHMQTMEQVTMGLAGMIIVKDYEEAALGLPSDYGVDDFPVVLMDRKYSAGGSFSIAALGDSMLVNGTAQPYLDCPAQFVRFRILNGSNARVYNLGFSDNRDFYVIAGDASLLSAPVQTNRLVLSNGERAEIMVDFSNDVPGSSLQLMSYAASLPADVPGAITGGMGGNGPLEAVDFGIMQINIAMPAGIPVTQIPSQLITHQPYTLADADRIRDKPITGTGMVSGMGNFFIDNLQFDMGVVNDTIMLGDVEVWNFTNTSNMAHPFHIHDINFYIIGKNGAPPPPVESGLKDVFLIRPNESYSIAARFENFADVYVPYMYHCHNLAHEDMGMMLQFVVADPSTSVEDVNPRDDIKLFPNPTRDGIIRINGRQQDYPFRLFGYDGRFIAVGKCTGGRIDLSRLSRGSYILQLQLSGGEIVRKFITRL